MTVAGDGTVYKTRTEAESAIKTTGLLGKCAGGLVSVRRRFFRLEGSGRRPVAFAGLLGGATFFCRSGCSVTKTGLGKWSARRTCRRVDAHADDAPEQDVWRNRPPRPAEFGLHRHLLALGSRAREGDDEFPACATPRTCRASTGLQADRGRLRLRAGRFRIEGDLFWSCPW